MITRIITNHIKEDHKEEYVKVSKDFCNRLKENDGCLEAHIYEVEGSDTTIVYIEKWPDIETANAVMKGETFKAFFPLLFPHFSGNEEVVLHEL